MKAETITYTYKSKPSFLEDIFYAVGLEPPSTVLEDNKLYIIDPCHGVVPVGEWTGDEYIWDYTFYNELKSFK